MIITTKSYWYWYWFDTTTATAGVAGYYGGIECGFGGEPILITILLLSTIQNFDMVLVYFM